MLAHMSAPAVEERVDVVVAEALRHVRDGRPDEAIETLSTSKAAGGNAFACNLLGLLHTTSGQNQKALDWFERSLRVGGRSPEILRNCAIALQQLGRLEAAIARYDDGLAIIPGDPDLAYRRGTALHLAGRLEAAAQSYETVLRSDPRHAEALANRGSALQEIGRLEEALACYDRAVALRPQDVSTWINRGNLLRALKRPPEQALASFEAALRIKPGHVAALQGCALLLQEMAAFDAALARCKGALEQAPRSVPLVQLEGNLLCAAGRPQEALTAFDAALAIEPGDPVLLCNRAAALCDLHRFEEALDASDEAILRSPRLPEAWTNRGSALLRLYRLEAALAAFEEACRLRPGYPEALSNRGVVLRELGRFAEALAAFDACLAARPDFPHALNSKSVTLLLLGDFHEGWKGFGGQLCRPATGASSASPEWPGLPLPATGLRLLVADEHGLGDAIQFARYLPLLKAAGADLTFLCRRSMHRLLRPLLNGVRVVEALGPDEKFDYRIGLAGLPRAFQANVSTVPAAIPYLEAEAERVARWAAVVGETGFRIGIGWQCNIDLRGEDSARAMALSCFAPLAELPGVRLLSLQKGAGLEQLAARPHAMPVETLAGLDEGPDAFLDTASVMQSLDLVVTCDTSLAHLAGALGRPVWVALRHVPEWRWLLDRDDSPWYPTMRLFRQSRAGDWEDVFARMAMALREQMGGGRE